MSWHSAAAGPAHDGSGHSRADRRRRRGRLAAIALTVVAVNGVAGALARDGWPVEGAGPPPNTGDPVAVAAAPPGVLSGRVVPRGNGRPSPVPAGLDGCDYNYVAVDTGRRICVPRTPPPDQRLDCAYLRAQGIGPVRVIGEDTRKLAGTIPVTRGAVLCAR